MKASHILGIAIVLLAATMGLGAAQNTAVDAHATCTDNIVFPTSTVSISIATGAGTASNTQADAIKVTHCGPWSMTVVANHADAKMWRTNPNDNSPLKEMFEVQAVPTTGPAADVIGGDVNPWTTAQTIASGNKGDTEKFDVTVKQPFTMYDKTGMYGISLTYNYAAVL